jgi:hypothetical protein
MLCQNFIDVFDRNEFEFLFRFLRNIDQIFFVQLRGNPGTHRCQAAGRAEHKSDL